LTNQKLETMNLFEKWYEFTEQGTFIAWCLERCELTKQQVYCELLELAYDIHYHYQEEVWEELENSENIYHFFNKHEYLDCIFRPFNDEMHTRYFLRVVDECEPEHFLKEEFDFFNPDFCSDIISYFIDVEMNGMIYKVKRTFFSDDIDGTINWELEGFESTLSFSYWEQIKEENGYVNIGYFPNPYPFEIPSNPFNDLKIHRKNKIIP